MLLREGKEMSGIFFCVPAVRLLTPQTRVLSQSRELWGLLPGLGARGLRIGKSINGILGTLRSLSTTVETIPHYSKICSNLYPELKTSAEVSLVVGGVGHVISGWTLHLDHRYLSPDSPEQRLEILMSVANGELIWL